MGADASNGPENQFSNDRVGMATLCINDTIIRAEHLMINGITAAITPSRAGFFKTSYPSSNLYTILWAPVKKVPV